MRFLKILILTTEPFEMRSVPLRCSGSTGCNSGMRRARLNSGVGAKLMVFEASQFPKLDKVTVFCPGLRDPNVLLEGLAKQNNETQCFVRWANKFQRGKNEKGEVKMTLQVMDKRKELKPLEFLKNL